MAHPVDTVYANRFLHEDALGEGVTGLVEADYSVHVATLTDTDGTVLSTAPITIVEQSGGYYGSTFEPDAVGDWELAVVYSAVTPSRRWGATVEVVTAAQADPAASLEGSITDLANAEDVAAAIHATPMGSVTADTFGYYIKSLFTRPVRSGNG
jgi:hypothetical protein